MWILIVLAVIIVLVLFWYILTLNKLRRTEVKISESRSGVDIALTKRFDLLTKLLDITKAYAKHEKATIMETIKMRSGMSIKECNEANSAMNEAQKSINIVAEAYPELKSSENFKQLQMTVADVEEHLSAARRAYNSNVSVFNQMIVSFPTSIIANSQNMTAKEFFEADAEKKNDVQMNFNS